MSSVAPPGSTRCSLAVLLAVAVLAGGALLLAAACAQAAVVHEFESKISEKISEEAVSCAGPGSVPGPLAHVNKLAVDPGEGLEAGHLWVAELLEERVERVDAFNDKTGECEGRVPGRVGQLENVSSLEKEWYGGVAVGHHTGEREVYVGTKEQQGGAHDLVAVFGPSGVLQHVWSGAGTPVGPFAASEVNASLTGVAVDESPPGLGDWASGDVIVALGGDSCPAGSCGVVDVLAPVAGGGEPTEAWQLRGTCENMGESATGAGACPGSVSKAVIPFRSPRAVAVDEQNGELFVLDGGKIGESTVDMFLPVGLAGEYEFVRQLAPAGGFPGEPTGVAVDGGAREGAGDVYVTEEGVVYEFDLASGELLEHLTGTPAGSFAQVSGVAVDPKSHEVYVGDEAGGVVDVFGPDLVVPDVTVKEPATEVTASTAVLHGTVNPLSEQTHEGAGCVFEYGTTTAYGKSVPCEPAAVPEGNAAAAVRSVMLEGLLSGTRYFYRVAASNKDGVNAGQGSEDEGEFMTRGPGVGQAFVSKVTSTSVAFDAPVDPNGAATSVFFEYGLTAGYGAQAPAAPGIALGAGFGSLLVPAVGVGGLAPGTVYHYRVVALSEVEVSPGNVELHEFVGSDQTFTTQGPSASGLPDGRDWEMVSPPVKDGALVEPIDAAAGTGGDVIQAAADGERFGFVADTPTEAQPRGNAGETEVLATRGAGGWQSRDLAIPHAGVTDAGAGGPGNEYRFFSEDLSLAVVQPFGAFDAAISDEASEASAFLHTDYAGGEVCAGGCYRPMATCKEGFANVTPCTRFGEYGSKTGVVQEAGKSCPPSIICGPQFVGASGDAQHVVLASSVALSETAIPEELHAASLYEWDAATGRLVLVSVLPAGEGGNPVAGVTLGAENADARNAISSDGSRVFFEVSPHGTVQHELYMREPGGGGGAGATVRLDLAQAGCPATCGKGPAAAVFQDASVDGSRVWFTDEQRLTANAGAKGSAPDLYECVITLEASGEPVCALTDLTAKSNTGEAGNVVGGVLGSSEDGGWLYFVATGVLENSGVPVAAAASGQLNLYVRHAGVTSLVAALSGDDAPDWGGTSQGATNLVKMTARVSPDGEWLAFMSDRSLTGYDNRDVRSGHADEEVFVYDAATGRLACASCNPSGARPIGSEYGVNGANMLVVGGDRIWEQPSWLAALVPGWTPFSGGTGRYQSRYLSDSGRLFFDARDPLVAQAVNENWDVYEWEPEGVPAGSHGCASASTGFVASSGGCVALISSGESADESAFLDASESGGDVFFMTTAKLSPLLDVDDSYDVYDAHECTASSACLPAPVEQSPACTTADRCRAAPSPQPLVFGAPASATFSGPGNLTSNPPPAPKAKTAAQLRAEKLAKALKQCRKKRPKSKRLKCEKAARKAYGAKVSAKKSNRKGSR